MKKNNDIEWALLVDACSASIIKNKGDNTLESSSFNGIDWKRIEKMANHHRVWPLLCEAILKSPDISNIPSTFLNKLKEERLYIAGINLKNTHEFIRLITLFNQNNIEVIPYKGIVLGKVVYQDLGLREFGDFDFLFHLKDHAKIHQLLTNRNYEHRSAKPAILEKNHKKYGCEYSYKSIQDDGSEFAVDLHWALGNKMLQLDIGFDVFKQLGSKQKLFDTDLHLLSSEGILLSTCIHHSGKEQFSELRYLCDVAAIIKQYQSTIDWNNILALSKRLKVKNLLLYALGVTAHVFDLKLSPVIQEALSNKKINRFIQTNVASLSKDKIPKSIFQIIYFHLSFRSQWSTKLKVLYYSLLISILPNKRDIKGEELSTLAYWTLFLIKPFRLSKKYLLSMDSSKEQSH